MSLIIQKAKILKELLTNSKIFTWNTHCDLVPNEDILLHMLHENGERADFVLNELFISCVEMLDQRGRISSPVLKSIEAAQNRGVPRPPSWFWEIFTDEDLQLFGSCTTAYGDYDGNYGTELWRKEAGLFALECAWDSQYSDLSCQYLAPTVSFLDFRDDFDSNWPRLLILLYHICHHMYRNQELEEMSEAREEGFLRAVAVAIESEVGLAIEAADVICSNSHATQTNEIDEDTIFDCVRSAFPAHLVPDDTMRAILAAHNYDYSESMQYISNMQQAPSKSVVSTSFSARDVLLHDPALSAEHSRPTQWSLRSANAARAAKLETGRTLRAPAVGDFRTLVQTRERILSLSINLASVPQIACDEHHGLVLHGWGAEPEAGALLGKPFRRGSLVRRIDLHTVHVREALQLVASILRYYSTSGARGRNSGRQPLELGLLVGRGLHSAPSGLRLAGNIAAFLKRNRASFREDDAWLVMTGL